MNQFMWIVPFILMHQGVNQRFPPEFYQIPEEIRQQATIVVSATFWRGRTPCMWMADGTRVWAIDSSFDVKKVYRGAARTRFISVNTSMLPKSEYVSNHLEVQRTYLVLLNPAADKMKKILKQHSVGFPDSLRDEEIVAIIELK